MPFARTVLGDMAPEGLGVIDAHEHIIIAGGRPGEMSADFVLAGPAPGVLPELLLTPGATGSRPPPLLRLE